MALLQLLKEHPDDFDRLYGYQTVEEIKAIKAVRSRIRFGFICLPSICSSNGYHQQFEL